MLTITRERGLVYALRSYAVYLDDRFAGRLRNGESIQIQTSPGRHRIRLKVDWCGSNTVEFQDTGEPLTFRCGSTPRGLRAYLAFVYCIAAPGSMLWLDAEPKRDVVEILHRRAAFTGFLTFLAALAVCAGFCILALEAWRSRGLCYDSVHVLIQHGYRMDGGTPVHPSRPPPRVQLVSLLLFGSTLVAAISALLSVKRFSFRRLLLLMLITGLLGALPHVLLKGQGPSVLFAVKFDKALPEKSVAAMSSALQPDAAAATWPKEMVDQMGVTLEDGILRVSLVERPRFPVFSRSLTADFAFLVEFRSGTTATQQRALQDFYRAYVLSLVMEAADDVGARVLDALPGRHLGVFCEGWAAKRAEYLFSLPASRWLLDREIKVPADPTEMPAWGSLTFSSNGESIWAANYDKLTCRLDVSSGRLLNQIRESTHQSRVALGSNGSIATTIEARAVRVWDAEMGVLLEQALEGPVGVAVMGFSPDGRFVATAWGTYLAGGFRYGVWEVASGHRTASGSWRHPNGFFQLRPQSDQVALAPNGQQILYAQRRLGMVLLIDLTSRNVREIPSVFTPGRPVAFAPDGQRFAAATAGLGITRHGDSVSPTNGYSVRIWDTKTLAHVGVLRFPDGISALAYSPDGQLMAVSTADSTTPTPVRLYCTRTFRVVAAIEHGSGVNALAFSPDGEFLATGHKDGFLRLWRKPQEP